MDFAFQSSIKSGKAGFLNGRFALSFRTCFLDFFRCHNAFKFSAKI